MNSFVVYRRISDHGQNESGLGLEAQMFDINFYLDHCAGEYQVLDTFSDVASGHDNNRPGLQKAIALARKEGAILLVAKLDRLSRRMSFISHLMNDKEFSLKVACMPDADRFMLHVCAALSEQEYEFSCFRKERLSLAKPLTREPDA